MKQYPFHLIVLLLLISACTPKPTPQETLVNTIQKKLLTASEAYKEIELNPRSINNDGSPHLVKSSDWTSGFFPGCLWYGYELCQDDALKAAAINYTLRVTDQQYNGKTHDMGFKVYCSFGNAYRITKDPAYKAILLQSAQTLITRFNPQVGCLRSWDHNADKWDFPVIIDNMMNLELLMWAFKETSDSSYYNIAISHANTTLKHHFRDDYSCYHVIDYHPETGEVENKHTHQGYAHSSAWARGQAWALYGYTMMYRETHIKAYLEQAQNITSYLFNHPNQPEDAVPYWDYNAPNIPNEPRDASAGAVICSALYDLALLCPQQKDEYLSKANKLLDVLSSKAYFAAEDAKHTFILEHSTGSFPHNSEIDVPLIYADYYYLEALLRKKEIEN